MTVKYDIYCFCFHRFIDKLIEGCIICSGFYVLVVLLLGNRSKKYIYNFQKTQ